MRYDFEPSGIQITTDVPICCSRCGKEFFINNEEIEYEDSNENAPMGTRINRMFYAESLCPNCGQIVSFRLNASEYPVGAIEAVDSPECSAGEILATPKVEIPYYDDSIYNGQLYICPGHLTTKPIVLQQNLSIAIVDGDAYIDNQPFLPDIRDTIWVRNSARELLPILVGETGSIRFQENGAVFTEILQTNPKIGTMRLLGKVAEAVIVRNCSNDGQLNKAWLAKARRNHTIQRVADSFHAIGTGLHSTKNRYPQKYSPSDPQRDIIWINDAGECALVAGRQNTSGVIAGLQVKVSGDGLNYIQKSLVDRRYEVPLVYFPMNDDFDRILDRVNRFRTIVEPGVDFIDVRELDKSAFFEIKDYYPLLMGLFTGRVSGDDFIREAIRENSLRNGVLAATLSSPISDIRIIG